MQLNRFGRMFKHQRAFLVLVVIGVLAVLLTICVGFLSYTRGEVVSVSSQRNKSDTHDVMHSAVDWTLSNICYDQMTSSGDMDPDKPLAFSIKPGAVSHSPFWMRMLQMGACKFLPGNAWGAGANGWGFPLQPAVQPGVEAPWAYLPKDFFPGGGMRGRYSVQIMDCNSAINVNDWNEDCNPSQAQMAHIIADAYGFQNMENFRGYRDMDNVNAGLLPTAPIRYQEAWRVASHTARYLAWTDWNSLRVDNTASYNWVTANTSWLSMYAPQYNSLSATIQSDGLPMYQTAPCVGYLGSKKYCPSDPPGDLGNYDRSAASQGDPQYGAGVTTAGNLPWCMAGFFTHAYTDPDTGRSPINVNTCFNSGETLPFNYWSNPPAYTMEGVWNVESLRRIIKVGWFYDPWTRGISGNPANWSHAQKDWNQLDPKAKMKVEECKLKLAYQYQETLCRYFTGSYAHANQSQKFAPICNSAIATYAAAFKPPFTPSSPPGKQPANFCTVTNYSAPRFDVGLDLFRKNCHDDFLAMTDKADQNPAYTQPSGLGTRHSNFVGDLGPDHTDGSVNFDQNYNPEIAWGKLDMRTACACYDNMIPGKPADIADFFGCKPYSSGDPIYELYALQLGRQEDSDDPYQIDPVVIHPATDPKDSHTMRKALGGSSSYPPPVGSSPGAPWPTCGIPGPPANNIYSRWVDNPNLSATQFYTGNSFPNSAAEQHIFEHAWAGATARAQTLLPKGNDISSLNAVDNPSNPKYFNSRLTQFAPNTPLPTGPWLDQYNQLDRGGKQHDVPWRQMCFSPDSFSMELTTTSTTFLVVINAQLVDSASIAANPTNPDLHTDQCWNQWGMVVEVAPDVKAETSVPDPADPLMFPSSPNDPNMNTPVAGAPPAPAGRFWQWYKNEMPRRTKTYQGSKPMTSPAWLDDSWLDDSCPSLVYRNLNNAAPNSCPYGRTAAVCSMPWNGVSGWTPPLNGGVADTENSTSTHIRDWKLSTNPAEATTGCDIHQVPPAGVPSGRGADVIYTPKNQIKKRILVRSIWCLNQGIEQ